ncbi:mCpol domain-containing protein [Nostoc sp. LEGE 06077]|uniref:mCpol domain-containing protein n=1 Tax=Nostoc sp. LEGE 06077 TaxID=915325 RepID=UPI0018811831|nr:mCpol domain-containing protein [Nostoc sp. LEGE 06077]MBE9206708.1 mCpol domain-containing protein [Nostoc sp. LEGE 06077]
MYNVYAFLDGDNIGERLSELLNQNLTFEAEFLSENIKIAIFEIEKYINSKKDIKIIIAGGDDVLIKYNYSKYGVGILEEIIAIFKSHTGLSMSCGVGLSIEQSIINLDTAKKKGRNQIENSLQSILTNKMAKSTTLYLFVTSDIPDVYVNSIIYCIENENYVLKEVCFLSITRDKGKRAELETQLQTIKDRVLKQLELLQNGKYLHQDLKTKNWDERDIDIQNYQKLRYAQANSCVFNFSVILYKDLENTIQNYKNRNELCIFDFSGIVKSFILDVYTVLRLNNMDDIYTFEITRKGRYYDERDLIHNLSLDHNEYEYKSLMQSTYVSKSMIINSTNQNLSLGYVDTINKLVESYADEFARFWLMIIFLVAVTVLAICIVIVIYDGWSWLEPWTFVGLGPALYVLSLIMRIFWKKELSVNPDFLYNRFKIWKAKKIKRDLNIK